MSRPPIGSVGLTINSLSPSGEVHIDGSAYPARAEQGQIGVNCRVVVTGFDPFGLLVREFVQSETKPGDTDHSPDDLMRAEERRKAAVESAQVDGSRHRTAQTPGRPGWYLVRVGLGMIFWGTALPAVSGLLMLFLVLMGREGEAPLVLALILTVVSVGTLLIGALVLLVGVCLCCTVPRESGARGWALSLVGCLVGSVIPFVATYLQGFPRPGRFSFSGAGVMGPLLLLAVTLAFWLCFTMLMRGIARYWHDPELGATFISYLIVSWVVELLASLLYLVSPENSELVGLLGCGAILFAVVMWLWFLLLLARLRAACAPRPESASGTGTEKGTS